MLLGHARGKVGSLVFSRVKGQQTTRARNFSPANPRTTSQMYQRALFTDAVKFFTRGRRNLFQFAFEDKKANESDYNAFMRNNAKRGVVISKAAFDLYGYPALGNWILTKGTLQPVSANLQTGEDTIAIAMTKQVATELTAVTTMGQLAQLLIDGVDYLEGDILTFVSITAGNPETDGIPSITPSSSITDTNWDILQIMLTSNSQQPLSDFGISATIFGTATKSLILQPVKKGTDTNIYAGTIIHSRNTPSGVRVSTQELVYNSVAVEAIEAARERTYIDTVVESWRTTQKAPVVSEAIMQGSIAQSIELEFNPGE